MWALNENRLLRKVSIIWKVNCWVTFSDSLVLNYLVKCHCRTDAALVVDFGDGTTPSETPLSCDSSLLDGFSNLCGQAYRFCTFLPEHNYTTFGKYAFLKTSIGMTRKQNDRVSTQWAENTDNVVLKKEKSLQDSLHSRSDLKVDLFAKNYL